MALLEIPNRFMNYMPAIRHSVVGVPLVAAVASIEDRCTFVCASELHRVVPHLFSSAFVASLIDNSLILTLFLG